MKKSKNLYSKYLQSVTSSQLVCEPDTDSSNTCLHCYLPIESNYKAYFHEACNKKFFGQLQTPLLAYNKNDLEKLASTIIDSQMAVTGVQAKVSLSIFKKQEKNEVRKLTIVGLYGDYILKPPSDYYPELPELESLTMHLANACGLTTVPHSLIYLQDGTLCYITKRIDRTRKEKLHMEDMCQLSERLTEDKYKGSHEQVAKLIIKYSANPLLDVSNFYEQVLFCYLTGNADMHLKNFSLVEASGLGYVLAPAYDLVPTALVNPADTEELALTLNGKKKKLKYTDFLKAYENSGLNKKVLDNTLLHFKNCLPEMQACISCSFVSNEFKIKYLALLKQNFKNLLN